MNYGTLYRRDRALVKSHPYEVTSNPQPAGFLEHQAETGWLGLGKECQVALSWLGGAKCKNSKHLTPWNHYEIVPPHTGSNPVAASTGGAKGLICLTVILCESAFGRPRTTRGPPANHGTASRIGPRLSSRGDRRSSTGCRRACRRVVRFLRGTHEWTRRVSENQAGFPNAG